MLIVEVADIWSKFVVRKKEVGAMEICGNVAEVNYDVRSHLHLHCFLYSLR